MYTFIHSHDKTAAITYGTTAILYSQKALHLCYREATGRGEETMRATVAAA